MHAGVARVTLPHGHGSGPDLAREAVVRALTGADELALVALEASSAAARATALLGRCVERIGNQAGDAAVVESLTAGDREALLLHIRRLTLGERLSCVIRCPSCREVMDLELAVADLLVEPEASPAAEHEAVVEASGRHYRVRFRLPTGKDQEKAARVAAERGAGAGARFILERCVIQVEGEGEELSEDLAGAIAAAMAERDPQAELMLHPMCPACGTRFESLLDTGSFFFEEIASRVRNVFREVHVLARHYHWSEAEILAMTPSRRRTYLALIEEERELSR